MTRSVDGISLITDINVNEYFNDAIHEAVSHQHVTASEETIVYIVNLLTYYTLSEHVFDVDEDGVNSKPLALIYKDALEASCSEERNLHLRKLGDTALFTSGFFAESFEKSLVGIDYFISMGGNAYSSLAEHYSRVISENALKQVFYDLSCHFIEYVDVLTEVSESSDLTGDRDILSLYEFWLKTGSDYASERLKENGILAFQTSRKEH